MIVYNTFLSRQIPVLGIKIDVQSAIIVNGWSQVRQIGVIVSHLLWVKKIFNNLADKMLKAPVNCLSLALYCR